MDMDGSGWNLRADIQIACLHAGDDGLFGDTTKTIRAPSSLREDGNALVVDLPDSLAT